MAGANNTTTGTGVDGSSMTTAAADFQRMTEVAFQAQMIVSQAQVVHQTKSGAAAAIGQTAAQVGQDIRGAARQN